MYIQQLQNSDAFLPCIYINTCEHTYTYVYIHIVNLSLAFSYTWDHSHIPGELLTISKKYFRVVHELLVPRLISCSIAHCKQWKREEEREMIRKERELLRSIWKKQCTLVRLEIRFGDGAAVTIVR